MILSNLIISYQTKPNLNLASAVKNLRRLSDRKWNPSVSNYSLCYRIVEVKINECNSVWFTLLHEDGATLSQPKDSLKIRQLIAKQVTYQATPVPRSPPFPAAQRFWKDFYQLVLH